MNKNKQLEELISKVNELGKANINLLEENRQIRLSKENLQKRIDEAIEYITHEWFKREQIGISPLSFSYDELQHILDILRGENDEVEIIEDTPKEDKKIEKLYGEPRHIYTENELYIVGKINEIIDRLNGENDGNR